MTRPRSFAGLVIAILAFGLLAPPPGVALADDGDKGKFPKEHRERLSGDSDAWLFGRDEIDSRGPRQASSRESERERQTEISVGTNVRVNAPQTLPAAGLLGRSETTIATTKDGKKLVAGFNDAQGFCGPPFGATCTPQTPPGLSGFAFSTNGGATWTDGAAPDPALGPNVLTRGDPWLARGKDDTFFYANLAVHPTTGADLGVSIHRGRFSGGSFAWRNVRVVNSPANPGNCLDSQGRPLACDFYDKNAIAADPKDDDNAVVTLTNFQGQPTLGPTCGRLGQFGFGQIEVWRTRDGGNTWHGPAVAGPEAADSRATCGDAGTLQQSSVPAFGPKGEVYVTWQFGPTFDAAGQPSTDADILVARSLDGGATFSTPVKVADINSMRRDAPVGYNRGTINDHPRIGVVTKGKHKGRVIVVFPSAVAPTTAATTAQNPTSVQIFASFSDNRGATWSTPAPLGGTIAATGAKRFWPSVTASANGESVDVVYYESLDQPVTGAACNVSLGGGARRIGPLHSLVNTRLVHSDNAGTSFGNPLTVSSVTTDWCTTASNIRPSFGDYIGSTVARNDDNSVVLATWADGRNGVPDTFFAPVRIGRADEEDDDDD